MTLKLDYNLLDFLFEKNKKSPQSHTLAYHDPKSTKLVACTVDDNNHEDCLIAEMSEAAWLGDAYAFFGTNGQYEIPDNFQISDTSFGMGFELPFDECHMQVEQNSDLFFRTIYSYIKRWRSFEYKPTLIVFDHKNRTLSVMFFFHEGKERFEKKYTKERIHRMYEATFPENTMHMPCAA